jgi:signal transduction histidine kinase/CheY-like chemotaxis protein
MGGFDDHGLRSWVSPAIAALVIAIFFVDLYTPLGYAPWVLYLVPLALCLAARQPTVPLVTAGAVSALVVVGVYLSPSSPAASLAPLNRVFGLLAVWILAIFGRQFIVARNLLHRQDWLQRGHAVVVEEIRGEQGVEELAQRALACLGPHVGAQVGVLYELDASTLRRVAGWGFEAGEGVPQTRPVGEGLLGQVARDGHTRVVSDVRETELRVSSGLIDGPVRHCVVAPVSVDGNVNGVFELGALHPVHDATLDLLDRVGESIGVAIRSARYRERLQALLEETQRQTERLQAQQEELRVANGELEHQTRSLGEAQARLETQQAELEQVNANLETQASELEMQKRQLLESQQAMQTNAMALARANEYKNEFLANMSHELRTPLNSTLILARLLADDKDGNLTADQIRYAETIHSAGNDLLALIDDILDLSKIEAGRMDLQLGDIRVHRVVGALQDMFEPVAAQRKLAFRVEIASDVVDVIRSDSQRLQQILRNLLSNAFKFTERGEVALTVDIRDESTIEFAVRDTGIGIARDKHDLVFEAFRQADGTTSRQFGGTGLGLSVSQQLARLLGGRIELSSTPGEGSTFRVVLPTQLEEARAIRPPSTRSPAPTRGSVAEAPAAPDQVAPAVAERRDRPASPDRLILVVEDDPPFASILQDLIHEQGFESVIASTAAEALALAQELRPAAVLLDIELPDGSGLYVLGQLKLDRDTRHVPVHVISVHDQSRIALELGAIGYAVKPIRREQVVEAIAKLQSRLVRRTKRVLLVEDDVVLRHELEQLLHSDGVEIVGAGTAAAALEQLAQTTFDCVVLDLKLPDASGQQLLEQMSQGERYPFPPVIVYTGRDLDASEEQLLRRYSQSIIIKGAKSPERLLDEVTLFLHQVESELPGDQRRMLQRSRHLDASFEGRRILLAEDDVRNIFALSSLLEPRGAQLCIARNGREALELLESTQKVDLVLMDIMMPEMDGLTAIREIRAQSQHRQLPIIAITAKATRQDQSQCLAAGANDYIAKPIDIDKLLSLCRVWMR